MLNHFNTNPFMLNTNPQKMISDPFLFACPVMSNITSRFFFFKKTHRIFNSLISSQNLYKTSHESWKSCFTPTNELI